MSDFELIINPTPCPNCDSTQIAVAGDDFDADACCVLCGLCTPVCYGIRGSIKVWNERLQLNKWFFNYEELKQPAYHI